VVAIPEHNGGMQAVVGRHLNGSAIFFILIQWKKTQNLLGGKR
jgi:hypothetical protein